MNYKGKKLTEEQLNDPDFFNNVSEEEKKESFNRAKKLVYQYELNDKEPIDSKVKHKNTKKKKTSKIKFSTIEHKNNNDRQ